MKAWHSISRGMYAWVEASEGVKLVDISPSTPVVKPASAWALTGDEEWYASLAAGSAPWIGPLSEHEAKDLARTLYIGHPLFSYIKESNERGL